jgi:ATP-dependent DNA ligase
MAPTMARRLTAARAVLPKWIKPQLTQLVDAAPEGDQWLHEIKFDGYRMHARLDRGSVKLLTRTGLDWTTNIRRSPKPYPRSTPARLIVMASSAAWAPTASHHSA